MENWTYKRLLTILKAKVKKDYGNYCCSGRCFQMGCIGCQKRLMLDLLRNCIDETKEKGQKTSLSATGKRV